MLFGLWGILLDGCGCIGVCGCTEGCAGNTGLKNAPLLGGDCCLGKVWVCMGIGIG